MHLSTNPTCCRTDKSINCLTATDNSIKLSHITLYFTILHICHQSLVILTTAATLKRDSQTSQGSTRMTASKTDSIEEEKY